MRKISRESGQGDRRQTRSNTVHEKEGKEQEKEEMRCEMRMTNQIDYNIIFTSVDTQVSHGGLQPDMNDHVQISIDHNTSSVASQVCVPQKSTMGPCTVPLETVFVGDEDNIFDGDEGDSKDKINSKIFDNRTPNRINNEKRLCNGDAKLLCLKFP